MNFTFAQAGYLQLVFICIAALFIIKLTISSHPGEMMVSPDISHDANQDVVFLRGLALTAFVGPDTWHRLGKPQPVILDLRVQTNIVLAGDTDDVLKTIHYGNLYKAVAKAAEGEKFNDLEHLVDTICRTALGPNGGGGKRIGLTATLPKALLLADGLALSTVRSINDVGLITVNSQHLSLHGMRLACVIGVNPHERVEKQQVVIDLIFSDFEKSFMTSYDVGVKATADGIEKSSFETLEAMATFIGRILCCDYGIGKVTVTVQKPSAIMFVAGSGVEITRTAKFYHSKNIDE